MTYILSTGDVIKGSTKSFTVNTFKNPISPEPKTGFEVYTFDSNSYPIGKQTTISLSGITTPTGLLYQNLTIADP
jgi:hypothetical protein